METITETELAEALEMNRKLAQSLGNALNLTADLESAGRFGVAKALQGYDRSKGSFLTYCRWFVRKYQILERKNILMPVKVWCNDYSKTATSVALDYIQNLATPEPEEEPDYSFLHSALVALPSKDRAILADFYFKGMSQKEIAATLDTSHQTVSNRLRTARNRLRKVYAEKSACLKFNY